MKNEYCCDLNDLLELFNEKISESDIIAAKALSEISSTIVKQRLDLRMTQKEFAQYVGVSQGMVSKWESSDYNFSIKSLAEIAVKLDLDLSVRLRKTKVSFDNINQYSTIRYECSNMSIYNGFANNFQLKNERPIFTILAHRPTLANKSAKNSLYERPNYLDTNNFSKNEWEVMKCYNM